MSDKDQAKAAQLLAEWIERMAPYLGVVNPEIRDLYAETAKFVRQAPEPPTH